MRCTIWYHLYNLKNVKNTHGGVFAQRITFTLFSSFLTQMFQLDNQLQLLTKIIIVLQ